MNLLEQSGWDVCSSLKGPYSAKMRTHFEAGKAAYHKNFIMGEEEAIANSNIKTFSPLVDQLKQSGWDVCSSLKAALNKNHIMGETKTPVGIQSI